jgi:tetrahydromethanopterin S-methyltransferase subunit G
VSVTEEARNNLYNSLREILGREGATTMMELLPPVGWADVARQSDVDRRFDEFERRIDQRFDELEGRFDARFGYVDQRFDELEGRFDARFGYVDQRFDDIGRRFDELDQRFATKDDLRQQTNRFIGWMLLSNATLVAAVSLIVSVLVSSP